MCCIQYKTVHSELITFLCFQLQASFFPRANFIECEQIIRVCMTSSLKIGTSLFLSRSVNNLILSIELFELNFLSVSFDARFEHKTLEKKNHSEAKQANE